jgi:arsenical pump membrane protein
MLLYIGNPTNIIIASSLDLGFIQYLKVMIIPTLTAGVFNFIFLYLYFRNSLKNHFKIKIKSHFSIRNRRDALLSISMMISMFICLLFSEMTHTQIWVITLFYALTFVIKDLGFSIYYYFVNHQISKAQIHKHHAITENVHSNDFLITVQRVPWGVTIFVASFFVFVEALVNFGAVDLVSNLLSTTSNTLYSGIMSFGFFSIILTNLVNNQPMTIFMSNVLISENLKMIPYIFKGSIYSLVIASNLGANISLIGALAGLMWKNILHIKGVKISFLDFFKVGIVITPIVFTLTLISLFLVLR